MKRVAVIMAGGAGERFWPVSRANRPKQLLRLTHPDLTLLEEAFVRAAPLFGEPNVYVAIGTSIEEPIRKSGVADPGNILVEPLKRNTLGCLCWAAANMLAEHGDQVSMAVLTADHAIGDPQAFRDCVTLAMDTAEAESALVTIGIRPTRPETGYGYIEADPATRTPAGVYRSVGFREKPDTETAKRFVESGRFFWNAGMFCWTLGAFLGELGAADPGSHRSTLEIAEALSRGDQVEAETLFADLPNVSVDYALMEKARNVRVVEAKFAWDDVGAWDALSRTLQTDGAGNVAMGRTRLVDAAECVIFNDDPGTVVSVLGVADLIIVATKGAVMVCSKSEAQRVRELAAIEALEAEAEGGPGRPDGR